MAARQGNSLERDRPLDRLFTRAFRQLESGATGQNDRHGRRYELGGMSFQVRCEDDDTFAAVHRPFDHLETPGEHSTYTLDVLTSRQATDALRCHVPPTDVYRPDGGERWYVREGSTHALYHASFGTLYVLDEAAGRGALWLLGDDPLPYVVRTSPFLPLFHWVFGAQGKQVLHAAVVGHGTAAVLIAGRTGSGKSTAALAATDWGLDFLGDDMVLVSASERLDRETTSDLNFRAFTIYCSAKLEQGDIGLFPSLAPAATIDLPSPGGLNRETTPQKTVLLFDRHLRDRVTKERPLIGGIVPTRILRGVASGTRLSPAQAFLHLAPNVLFQLPGGSQAAAQRLRRIAGALPFFAWDLGAPEQIPERLLRFLEEHGPSSAQA